VSILRITQAAIILMSSSPYRCSVLLVDDEPAILALLTQQLGHEFDVLTACSVDQARSVLNRQPVDIVLSDLQLDDGSGLNLLEWVMQSSPKTARVLLSGTARVEDAAEAINKALVHRLLLKPWRSVDLLENVRGVARTLLLERSHERLIDDYRRLNQELEDRVAARTAELAQALAQLETKNQFLEKMALTDALTGMANRRAIELIARKELLRRTRTPSPVALAVIDADHFKNINSNYLLSGGDHVLISLGRILQATVRGSDSVGRIGGEEFLVVAPYTDAAGAETLGERLRTTVLENPPVYQGSVIPLSVSVGVAVAEAGVVVGYEALRELASAALAEAKLAGRNRTIVKLATGDAPAAS
jgi:diguanylate cyclase (GGDEF)-like protein